VARPPKDTKKRIDEHRKLSESVLQHVLLKLDNIETETENGSRAMRKELVVEVQGCLNKLDAAKMGTVGLNKTSLDEIERMVKEDALDPESTSPLEVQAAKAGRTKVELLRDLDGPVEGASLRVMQGSREKAEKSAQPPSMTQAEHWPGVGAGSLPGKGLTVAEALQSMRGGKEEPGEFVAELSRAGVLERLKTALLQPSATEDSTLLMDQMIDFEEWKKARETAEESFLFDWDAYEADDSVLPRLISSGPPGKLPDPHPESNHPGPNRRHASEYSSGPKSRLQDSDATEGQPSEEYGSGDYTAAPGKSPMRDVGCRFY
jgi:hypothetical protein